MTAFSEIDHRQPPGHVNVPPEAWSSQWSERPTEEVCIGLRFVPDQELEDARVEAIRRAKALFPDHARSELEKEQFEQSFLDTLVRWVIARGTCDPNDVSKPWDGWADAPEDICVEVALHDLGAQLIYDKWEEMRIAADIALPAATDADLALLPALLARLPALAKKSKASEQRLRRLLRFVLEELEGVEPPAPAQADAEPGAAG